ncbi:S-adenosyl-L-methionine-dependent methyltransferase [Trichoderma aethiopicum]
MGSIGHGENYVLGRNFVESVRLDAQHFLYRLQNGFTIDPRIPIGPDTKIADMGTGTGIWLLDVASQVPSTVQLNGFDISDEQFPCQSSLPSNVKLSVMDAFAEVPEKHRGKYDIVHMRLWCAIVQDGDPSALIRHATQLLKPGGYLQWEDISSSPQHMVMKGAEVEALYSYLAQIQDAFRLELSWLADLPTHAKRAGLDVVQFKMEPFLPHCVPIVTKTFLMVHNGFLDAAYKAGLPFLPPREEVDHLLAAALHALKNGASYYSTPLSLLAQKPLSS